MLSLCYNRLRRTLYRHFNQAVLQYMEYCKLYQKDNFLENKLVKITN